MRRIPEELLVKFPEGLTTEEKWVLYNSIVKQLGFGEYHSDKRSFVLSIGRFPYMMFRKRSSALSRGTDNLMGFKAFQSKYLKVIYLGGE